MKSYTTDRVDLKLKKIWKPESPEWALAKKADKVLYDRFRGLGWTAPSGCAPAAELPPTLLREAGSRIHVD